MHPVGWVPIRPKSSKTPSQLVRAAELFKIDHSTDPELIKMVRKAMAKAGELRRNGRGSGPGQARAPEAAGEPRPPKVVVSDAGVGPAYERGRSTHELNHLFTPT